MSKSKPINLLLTTLLLLFYSNTSFCQKLEPKERIIEPDHIISSKIMGKDYELYISFPSGYSTKDTISYPVLYALDGKSTIRFIDQINKGFSSIKKIEDVIIVGINPGIDRKSTAINRYYDYTISVDTIKERKTDKKYGVPEGTVKTGGAAKFLESIKSEIVPFIDKNYKTNNDRGIIGHSLGGLFTAYCLINSDGYFTRFGISSPSLYWNNEELLNQAVTEIENKYYNKIEWNIPPTKVFTSVGELESSSMIPEMVKFSTYLADLDSDSIELKWQIIENETHKSVIPVMLINALSFLYGKEK